VDQVKIIAVSNFDDETVSDSTVCENVGNWYGPLIVDLLNNHSGERGPRFYKLVPDDHKLYEYDPNA
jgi:hypothetical protein